MFKFILQKFVAGLARKVLQARRPEIIGITGSVGKTSTKEAIARVLAKHFSVRETYKNYNNEIGLPLTVLGLKSPGKSLPGWFKVYQISKKLTTDKNTVYPDCLVLEMGVDRPRDMDYLLTIIKPTRAVITKLGQAHLEFFKSLEELHEEKIKLARAIPEDGWIIYNYDDERLREIIKSLPQQSVGYGFSLKAEVSAEYVSGTEDIHNNNEVGVSFKMKINGSTIPVFLPNCIGRPAVYSALAAAAVGFSYGLNGLQISEALREVKQPAGRLNLIAGKNNTLIIDDTYNSSPDSVFEGLNALKDIPAESKKRIWVVLGDMRELGALSKKGHEDVGSAAAEVANIVVAVGQSGKIIYEAAKRAGLKEVYLFTSSVEAANFIDTQIQDNDLLFIKGSQAVRMEKIVKRLMKDPDRASELLVRQGEEWKDK